MRTSRGRAIIRRAKGGRARWEFEIQAANGKTLANGYGYDTRRAVMRGIDSLNKVFNAGLIVGEPETAGQ